MNSSDILDIFIICGSWEFGKWLYEELRIRYKIGNGTAYRTKNLTIEGKREWVQKMKKKQWWKEQI